jgi:PAS domain S-box-containing protein
MSSRDSIRSKLQRAIVFTTAAVLGLTCAVFIVFEWRGLLAAETRAALNIARLAADASSGMLAFRNQAEATKLLSAFQSEPDVRTAALYDATGKLFAEYHVADADRATPTVPQNDGLRIADQRLVLFQPVIEDGKRFGTLYLKFDLRDMYARLWRYGSTAILIFLGALAGAFAIGHVLQKKIAGPILSLARIAQSISRERDYGARAERMRGGELEVLTTAFNQMLDTIQEQQGRLRTELAERERAQKAEARERQLLATTLASIGDGVIVADARGCVASLNAEAERLTGWNSADAAGRPLPEIFRIINEASRQPAENPVEKVLRLGAIVGLANHTILIRRDGSEIPIDDSAAPIRQAGGAINGVVLVFRDFTERKHAEQVMQESATRDRARAAELQAIMEAVPAAIWISRDRDCRVITGNRASFELLRLSPPENPSLSAPEGERPANFEVRCNGRLLRPDELPVQRAARGEEVRDLEEEIRFSDGASRYMIGNATPLRDEHGEVCGAVAAFVDITERKRAEEDLRRAHTLLETLLKTAPVGFAYLDRELRFVTINTRLAEMNGLPAASHIGKFVSEIVPTLAPAVHTVTTNILATGEPVKDHEFEGDTPLAPGVQRFWNESWFPVRDDPAGAITGFGVVVEEITERKQAEVALREAHAQLASRAVHLEKLVNERTAKLQETIGDLETFSYSIVHDLRAPLRAMQNFARLLVEECGPVNETAQDYANRITTAAERMDRLIQEVLNYSRVARAELPLAPVNTAALVRSIVETYPALQPPRAQVELNGNLPPVHANEAALTQCISNLLGNAVKFIAPGVTPHVRVWGETVGHRVRLHFQDNGIGIEREAHEKIFQMFQRLSKRYEGTGIGLTIVKKAIEKMGGTVGLESEPGKGSTFSLELDSVRVSPPIAAAPDSSNTAAS